MLAELALAGFATLSKAERDAYFDKPPQNTLRDCGSEPLAYGECRLPPGITVEQARAKLGSRQTVWWRDGDQFLVLARRDTDQAYLCCAARGRMDHIHGDLWVMRLRIADLDRATIDVSVRPLPDKPGEVYRGPEAPPPLTVVNNLRGHLTPEVIDSRYLDSPRAVLIYTPPDFDPAKKYPVVYMADGNMRLDTPGFIEPLILKGELPPMVLVEIWPGNSHRENEDRRSEEYLLGWPNGYSYFAKHEGFVLKELMPLAERKYGASSDPKLRVVTGFSSGAAWAISMGLRHPDVFPTVIAQSLVWDGGKPAQGISFGRQQAGSIPILSSATGSGEFYRELNDNTITRFYLTAGTLEPEFYRETLKFAQKAKAVGHDVQLETTVSGHTLTIWPPLLVHGLKWAFADAVGKPKSANSAAQAR